MGDWRSRAACLGSPEWLWFADKSDPGTVRAAKAVCFTCRVRAQCLSAVLAEEADMPTSLIYGTRGGTSATQRRDEKRRIEARPQPAHLVRSREAC